jgi:hypothetical protein
VNPTDPLPPCIFIASAGQWHITTATYQGGADTKCGLENACGFIVAISPMVVPPLKTYRRVASEHGRLEDAGAPDCEECFGPKRKGFFDIIPIDPEKWPAIERRVNRLRAGVPTEDDRMFAASLGLSPGDFAKREDR